MGEAFVELPYGSNFKMDTIPLQCTVKDAIQYLVQKHNLPEQDYYMFCPASTKSRWLTQGDQLLTEFCHADAVCSFPSTYCHCTVLLCVIGPNVLTTL